MTIRARTWQIMHGFRPGDKVNQTVALSLQGLILLNVLAVILGTVSSIESLYGGVLWGFEIFSIVIFTAEYIIRIWSCVEEPQFHHPVIGRLRYATTPLIIIDLIAFLPFYLPFVVMDTRFLRVIRMFRIIRIAKIGRYSSSLRLIFDVLKGKKEELVMAMGLMTILMVLSASLMYYCERDAQPKAFSSIPAALWWTVITMTTIGYGDVYPITLAGKILASFTAILGIGMLAIPTGLLGAGFIEEFQKRKTKTKITCPHCGKIIERDHVV
jgi:voltage-gated potassium channel